MGFSILIYTFLVNIVLNYCIGEFGPDDYGEKDHLEAWEAWKQKHDKSYATMAEEEIRVSNFKVNFHKVKEHNEAFSQNMTSFQMTLNNKADLNLDVFGSTNCVKAAVAPLAGKFPGGVNTLNRVTTGWEVPAQVDWRERGWVTHVKDQGDCRACWAFAALGVLEAQYFNETGSLIDLSAQELVDCNFIFTHGCDGGSLTGAYMFGQSNGITSEQEYPYTGFKRMCDFKKVEKHALKVTDFFQVNINGDENVLKEFVATYGPVAALVNVKSSFGLYHSGVYYEPDCNFESIYNTMAVLIVGYGTSEQGDDYWIVKNSWGVSWGMGGYIWMARNRDSNCAIAHKVYFATV